MDTNPEDRRDPPAPIPADPKLEDRAAEHPVETLVPDETPEDERIEQQNDLA